MNFQHQINKLHSTHVMTAGLTNPFSYSAAQIQENEKIMVFLINEEMLHLQNLQI